MKFSIIIPTYKRLEYLREAVESVLNQTYLNYELIIVNDYPEQSMIINDYYCSLDNVIVINLSKSSGGNVARNTGLNYATGEIIAFLDDDDTWCPTKLEAHAQEHKKYPNVGLIFSECIYFSDSDSKTELSKVDLPDNVIEAMSRGKFCPVTSSAVTVKSVCFKDCGLFDDELISFQDWDMWFRIAQKYNFRKINEALINFRQHSGTRTSMDIDKRLCGLNQIITKWGKNIRTKEFNKRHKAIAIYYYLKSLINAGAQKQAFISSFKLLQSNMLGMLPVLLFFKAQIHIFLLSKLR